MHPVAFVTAIRNERINIKSFFVEIVILPTFTRKRELLQRYINARELNE